MSRRHISASERAQIFADALGICHICGLKIDGGHERWDVEHVIPLAMGGDEDKGSDNLKPAHVKCHLGKTAVDKKHIGKAKRMQQRRAGISKQTRNPIPGSKASKWKRTIDGRTVLR